MVKAFQSVADVLRGLEYDRKAYTLAERGVRASKSNLDLTRELLKQNLATANQALNVQQQFAQANTARIQAKSDLYGSAVLLYQALGGGVAIETVNASPWMVQVTYARDVAKQSLR